MKSKKILSIITFGCKVNRYESSCVAQDFSKDYQILSHFSAKATIFVVNSCTVTARAGAKCRQMIRKILRLKAKNPEIVLIVTGCLANLEAEQIKNLGDVDHIVEDKSQIYATFLGKANLVKNLSSSSSYNEQMTSQMFGRTRAFVKIQDGCNFFCTYCIIPFARGVPVFRSPQKVLAQIKILVQNGYREVVLGGINIGLYSCKGWSLQDLLFAIEEIAGLERIRISSIEPQHISSIWDFIQKSKKLAHHLHIPLQSGNSKILQTMGRHYNTEEFAQIVQKLLKLDLHFAIGCDVIVGFPGESQQDFQKTCQFIESLPIAYLHIFPYSRREGTKAAQMSKQLPSDVKKQRAKILEKISQKKKKAFANFLIADKVLLSAQLEQEKDKYATGVSDRYLAVYVEGLPADGRQVILSPQEIYQDGLLVSLP